VSIEAISASGMSDKYKCTVMTPPLTEFTCPRFKTNCEHYTAIVATIILSCRNYSKTDFSEITFVLPLEFKRKNPGFIFDYAIRVFLN
jgi:hypothetical protein